jgi:FkbM family methyltransferase
MSEIYEELVVDNFNITCIKNDMAITPKLREGILWGQNMEEFIKELYEPNTNMIDIGAHIGTFSIIMSKYLSVGNKIFSFEPVFYDLLKKNISNNNLNEKVVIFDNGLSNKFQNCSPFIMELDKIGGYGAFSFKKTQELKIIDELNSKGINFYKLDYYNFENISFIKLDVKFFESEILEGGINTLLMNKPTILIELFLITPILNVYHDEKETELVKKTTFSCFSLLSMLGYVCFPIIPEDGEFLFIHKSKANLIEKATKILNP